VTPALPNVQVDIVTGLLMLIPKQLLPKVSRTELLHLGPEQAKMANLEKG